MSDDTDRQALGEFLYDREMARRELNIALQAIEGGDAGRAVFAIKEADRHLRDMDTALVRKALGG